MHEKIKCCIATMIKEVDIPDIPISKMLLDNSTDSTDLGTNDQNINVNPKSATSCRFVTLKSCLAVISLACLLSLLFYNLLNELFSRVEFWAIMDKYQNQFFHSQVLTRNTSIC